MKGNQPMRLKFAIPRTLFKQNYTYLKQAFQEDTEGPPWANFKP